MKILRGCMGDSAAIAGIPWCDQPARLSIPVVTDGPPVTMEFPGGILGKTVSGICDHGLLHGRELRDLLALAYVVVRPGRIDPFEDRRLPGKVPKRPILGSLGRLARYNLRGGLLWKV